MSAAPSPFAWRRRVPVRDVDAFGVVWYGNYLAYCDEARAEMLRASGLPPHVFIERGLGALTVETHCRFLAPARFDDEIEILVSLRADRTARLDFHFEIRRVRDDSLLTRIDTVTVLVRQSGELLYVVPDDIRAAVAGMIETHGIRP